jgi:hypothetical protein
MHWSNRKDLRVLCVNYDERLIAIVRPSHGAWKFETVQSERSRTSRRLWF